MHRVSPTIALALFLACCGSARALDVSLDISQYAHRAWPLKEGFFKATNSSIAQTPDGYLWLGTDSGLLRFDGVKTVRWEPPGGEKLPSEFIRSLLSGRDGTLWIGADGGLVSWKDGKLTRYPQTTGLNTRTLTEDRSGTVWVSPGASGKTKLCAIRDERTQCYGEDGRLGYILDLIEDKGGSLWAATQTGLWRWKPDAMFFPRREIDALVEDGDGSLIAGGTEGIAWLRNGKEVAPPALQPAISRFSVARALRDRDGGLWLGTENRGLVHIHAGKVDQFSRVDGLSGNRIYNMFEDREGSIWVATEGGIDRFRNFAVPGISVPQGLADGVVGTVLADRQGNIWMGGSLGLNRWRAGVIARIPVAPGPHKNAYPRFEDEQGRIWLSTARGDGWFENGAFHPIEKDLPGWASAEDDAGAIWVTKSSALFRVEKERTARIDWATLNRQDYALTLLPDSVQRGIWLGFSKGDIALLKDGRLRTAYTSAQGLGAGRVEQLQFDQDGAIWAATQGGLSRIKDGRIVTLSASNGLPCDGVHWMMRDDSGSVWIYTNCGLVRAPRSEWDSWVSDPRRTIHTTVFDEADGVRSFSLGVLFTPAVARARDGKLWFVTGDGVGVIDPKHIATNKLPPPVHIEQIIADDKPYDVKPGMRLPPNVRNLRIEFTALSLVAPEKVHFRYKLEGQNQNWHEVINERHATYTNLGPRQYRFRVIASNNSGVWNETGDTLDFSIAPAYYQTNWFRALLAATVLVLMWTAYQLRVRQVQREARRLRDVIETIPAYVWSALPDGFVDFINRRWLEFSGFTLDQSMGWGWADALHPEDRGPLIEAWRAAIASGKPMEAEARMRGANGQYRWLLFLSVPQRDQSGKIVKWYGKSTDIEDRKRAEEERERLRQLEADLAHTNRVSMMGELAASVAHEVNQPLTGIVSNGSACLRFLAGDAPDLVEVREAVSDIVRDGKRAGEVIARIRALTKRAALPREKLDLNETIREVLAIVGDEAKKRSVVIRTQFADGLTPVFGDRVQLQQVLLNLVMNAMDAMSSVNDRARELTVTTRNIEPNQVQVTVEDSGTGLDPNIASRIFEPFYTTKSGGMGVGLSISRSIVQNHGGRLWTTANDGPGTSFHFSLPQYHGEEQNARVGGV